MAETPQNPLRISGVCRQPSHADGFQFVGKGGDLVQDEGLTFFGGLFHTVDVLRHQALADAESAAYGGSIEFGVRQEDLGDAHRLWVIILKALKRHILVKFLPVDALIIQFIVIALLISSIPQPAIVEQRLPQGAAVVRLAIDAVIGKPYSVNPHCSHFYQNTRSTSR